MFALTALKHLLRDAMGFKPKAVRLYPEPSDDLS
jgi:hypothetical protein